MDRPAAQDSMIALPAFFRRRPLWTRARWSFASADRVRIAEEVGNVQEVDVQRVARDPLPAVQQPAQLRERRGDPETERVLEGVAGAHLVGDGADTADPGGDVRGLGVRAAAEERLEEPWRLEDAQLGLLHLRRRGPDAQRSLSLHAGEVVDGELSWLRFPRRRVGGVRGGRKAARWR